MGSGIDVGSGHCALVRRWQAGAQVRRCAGGRSNGTPSRLAAQRTGPGRLRRGLRGVGCGVGCGERCAAAGVGGACGQGHVDHWWTQSHAATYDRALECAYCTRRGRGQRGRASGRRAPSPASGVDGQSTAPHKVNPLAHDGHGWCHGGDRHPHRDGRPGLRDSVDCGVASRPTRRRQLGRSRHFRVACLCWGCCAERWR